MFVMYFLHVQLVDQGMPMTTLTVTALRDSPLTMAA
jgi:hypothetical protein